MITPLDIQNKVFSKGVRGYKEEEVDGFLDLLTLDFENLIDQNEKLKDQIKNLTADLETYKKSESAVLETLEAAKSLMRDISASAEKRAQILVKNAELDAELILREAKESVERLTEESQSLKSRLGIFRTRYKTLLESELQKFDILSTEIFADENMEELQEITKGEIFQDEDGAGNFKTITNLRIGDKR
ncbi:DivIVA domain-containing protein [Sinanaerobacter sp. ZZT-01]|uniref:DivIVA domain-containing protein n=1 Tax=Sinanaerobacter sp. ZZT-01 TaxID=3111540 RepID=UPI002D7835B4|nr:DivIVA domain-containing protein [Sinanaerobacter sp. ZZT-01]WRR92828.1 DivIVA domain-containing protein [Sinanaerobacter sp. ZZT-01]